MATDEVHIDKVKNGFIIAVFDFTHNEQQPKYCFIARSLADALLKTLKEKEGM
jgi:hypothetical protein